MKLVVVAVGQRVPDWARTAWDDYARRFPPELRVELKAVKTEPRTSRTLETLYAAERQRIEAAIPKGAHVVALDERGAALMGTAPAGLRIMGAPYLTYGPPPVNVYATYDPTRANTSLTVA